MRSYPAIVYLAVTLALPSLCFAGSKELKNDLQGVKKQIKEKNLLLDKTRRVETKVTGEIQEMGKSLREKQASLAQLGRELASVETGIGKTLSEIDRVSQETQRKKVQINQRVAAAYKGGEVGNMRIFFSSESFPQMTENLRYMRGVLENDRKLFAQYHESMERLKVLKASLEQDAARKEGLRRSIEAKKREIEQEKAKKSSYLTKVRQDKQTYLASIKELQANAQRLQSMFERLERLEAKKRKAAEARKALEARNRKAYSAKVAREQARGKGGKPHAPQTQSAEVEERLAPPVPDKGLGSQKGRLSLPVRGTIVDRFGRHKNPEFNAFTVSNGISIAAPAGTQIHAVYDGEVIFANYFKGYGNMVIVDHGGGFFSLYAHASSIAKHVGSRVSKNEILASVGDMDSTKGPMLYFEIRYQGKPVDPSPWFR